uniref:Response regulatory domain-containing protein n=1 Tax=Candidatus Kentrum sp. UNK TaxID=2126344 RepID=A0A451AE92_9GAMM|nr:MAG: hypothetical protein BECKUNK1418G_GA0071005_104421 [Candidatus Kentron sp. UNK]VFK71057.1 MAG: hypothetical protein BECKUNK1418H_GA0071006_104821 [Candidatus Kentron sp. UNK]
MNETDSSDSFSASEQQAVSGVSSSPFAYAFGITTMKPKKLLVIDDSATFREAITLAGEDLGWEIYADDTLDEIKDWLAGNRPDVVLFDWELSGKKSKNKSDEVLSEEQMVRRRRKYARLLQDRQLTERTLLLSDAMDEQRRQFVAEYGLAGARLKPFDLGRFEEEIRLPDRFAASDLHGIGERQFSNNQLVEMLRKIPPTIDILDRDLNVLWSNKSTKGKRITREQRLITKWLLVEIEAGGARNVVRRLDWDGGKGCFLESRLYPIGDGLYGLERDWRNKGERPHDHEFLNLEDNKDLSLDGWLRAVARLLAQRYAISRFRVYKIAPLPHTQGLEQEHAPLVVPKFQSGGGIDPNTEAWLRGGFEPRCIPHIKDILEASDAPAPKWIDDSKTSIICEKMAHVRYGEPGTSRVLFPVRGDGNRVIALLAMDRRLDHIKGLQGFDKEVVELATRMASDEAGVLSQDQWSLMKGLVQDIARRVGAWLQEDEERRTAEWRRSISSILIKTFAVTTGSLEMTYDGISRVCAELARTWNEEKISGMIRGSTSWLLQERKGLPISDWYVVLINDTHWQAVAGWGNIYEIYRQQGEQMQSPAPNIVAIEKAWTGVMIQDLQAWLRGIPHPSRDSTVSKMWAKQSAVGWRFQCRWRARYAPRW